MLPSHMTNWTTETLFLNDVKAVNNQVINIQFRITLMMYFLPSSYDTSCYLQSIIFIPLEKQMNKLGYFHGTILIFLICSPKSTFFFSATTISSLCTSTWQFSCISELHGTKIAIVSIKPSRISKGTFAPSSSSFNAY